MHTRKNEKKNADFFLSVHESTTYTSNLQLTFNEIVFLLAVNTC